MEEINKESDNLIYELGYHVLPTVPEERLGETVDKLRNLVTQKGGIIISEEFPRQRILSYEIKKRVEAKYTSFNKVYFGWIKFELSPEMVNKIKEGVEGDENILRFIIIKTVRENTMSVIKAPIPMVSRDMNIKEETVKNAKEKTEVSEAEIDKSIDELVGNDTL